MFKWLCKKDKLVATNKLDLSKITTIAQCRDLIIILNQTYTATQTPCIMPVTKKALTDFKSLDKLLVKGE